MFLSTVMDSSQQMMFSTALPAELVLQIISYFGLSTVSLLSTLNKSWQNFVQENESTIYHAAAFLEGYIPTPSWTLDDPRTRGLYSDRTWFGVTKWKEFCQRRRQIGNSWVGKGPSAIIRYQNNRESKHPQPVHRIKVDEKAGYLINTAQIGGLVVTDIEADEVLWALPVWSVRAYAHLEYEQGYAIFDRLDGNKEVWRRTRDINPECTKAIINNPWVTVEGYDHDSRPDERQIAVQNRVNASYPLTGKGHFSPWAVLHMPESSRAYRLVYPNLLIASKERVYIWDVRTARIVQVIEGIQPINPPAEAEVVHAAQIQNSIQNDYTEEDEDDEEGEDDEDEDEDEWEDEEQNALDQGDIDDEPMPEFLGSMVYVEISSRHVFLAGRYVLRIFSRETGKSVLNIPSTRTRYGFWKWDRTTMFNGRDEDTQSDLYRTAKDEGRELVNVPLHPSSGPHQITEANKKQIIDSFTAVHVSEDGKHVVALLSGSRVLFLPNFESIIQFSTTNNDKSHRNLELEQNLYINTFDIQLMPPRDSRSVYLAFNNGRIVVVTSLAVFILVPEIPSQHFSTPTPTSPSLLVRRIPYFSNPSWLDACSCLMLSDTGIYLNYNPSPAHIPREFLIGRANSGDRSLQEILMRELELQDIINGYIDDQDEYEQYHHLPNGDRIVVPRQFAIEISDKSVIFGVDFAPHCRCPSNPSLSPTIQPGPPLLITM